MVRYSATAICDKCGKDSLCGVHLTPLRTGDFSIEVVYDAGWEKCFLGNETVLCPDCVKKFGID